MLGTTYTIKYLAVKGFRHIVSTSYYKSSHLQNVSRAFSCYWNHPKDVNLILVIVKNNGMSLVVTQRCAVGQSGHLRLRATRASEIESNPGIQDRGQPGHLRSDPSLKNELSLFSTMYLICKSLIWCWMWFPPTYIRCCFHCCINQPQEALQNNYIVCLFQD